ncbi:transcriptional regulator GutM [[Haemophilus] felis]|nr:transcriptional regulator GutM [[Haemophilus] felis]
MDATSLLIAFAVCMWLLQIILGWLQVSAFNRAFMAISQKGKILTGRNSGRFNPKSVVILALDDNRIVIDSLYMRGFSVFARPQKLLSVINMKVDDIQPEHIFPRDKRSQFALKVALSATHRE